MNLSAPIPVLKQQAKALSRTEGIPLSEALNRIANREGFTTWSLLSAKTTAKTPAATLLAKLRPGDMVLLGSRPGQGKTRLSLALAVEAMRHGTHAAFFTLDFTMGDVANQFRVLGADLTAFQDKFVVDTSDQICAEYIVSKLASAPAKTLVVIDYLQLLDQKRENPDLLSQVQQLRDIARDHQVIVVCLSQIDRRFDSSDRSCPGIDDVRLPNPLDMNLFDKTCFLNQGTMQFGSPAT